MRKIDRFNHFMMQVEAGTAYAKTASPSAALTIDIDYYSNNLPLLLNFLSNEQIPATFFITGKFCKNNPEIVNQIIQAGHEIGNHSYSHPNFTQLQCKEITYELEETDRLFMKYANISTKPWFRPPYGAINQKVTHIVRMLGYKIIGWTLDIGDCNKIISVTTMKKNLLACKANEIILTHTTSSLSIEALTQVLPLLKQKGLQFIKISQLFNNKEIIIND